MQLFITDFQENGNNIVLQNPDILEQTRKVLRMKIGDKFFVQQDYKRHEIEILDRDKTTIKWKILDTQEYKNTDKHNSMIIAMPNKRVKAELIVQKLSEIWINNVCFRPSERSILKERNDKKLDRLKKISKEAVEQSRWRELPKIEFIKDISKIIKDKNIIVFDKTDEKSSFLLSSWKKGKNTEKCNSLCIIGPEWWLTKNDYQNFWNNYKIISLWENILRMETASIIWASIQKNID